MKNLNLKRFFFVLLLVTTLLAATNHFLPEFTVAAEGNTVTIIACSDFQNPSGNVAGSNLVKSILKQIKSHGHTDIQGFLCCGDYDYGYSRTSLGIDFLTRAIKGDFPDLEDDRFIFVQGNHDEVMQGSSGLTGSGLQDTEDYGVFVIDEADYMWAFHGIERNRIQNTADNLKAYLDIKSASGYNKPIFVLSHLPLHYSMRTKNDGDGIYADLIFNILNEAGQEGLNIFFLFGHNHSNDWDDYLGGSAVYLAKGDEINIAQSSRSRFKKEILNFTYLNAGYIGYYNNHNGADDTLTMTVFTINDESVLVERYSAAGIHNL